jgi:hypothetical protein
MCSAITSLQESWEPRSLVGVGEECISAEHDDCRRLVAQLSVYDERENSSPLDVSFMLMLYGPSRRRSEESCDDEEFVA